MPVNQVEKLLVHGRGLFLIAIPNRLGRAVMQVISQQRLPYPAQCFLNGGDLNDDVGAVTLLLHHLLEPANLAFNPSQPLQVRAFDLRVDANRFTAHTS
jgi:hypothetical protein